MSGRQLYARIEEAGNLLKFPAFVWLPACPHPDIRAFLTADQADPVKLIALSINRSTPGYGQAALPYKLQIALRWGIPADRIKALSVSVDGLWVLVQDSDDWRDCISTIFSHVFHDYRADGCVIAPSVHIRVLLDIPTPVAAPRRVVQTTPPSTSSHRTQNAAAARTGSVPRTEASSQVVGISSNDKQPPSYPQATQAASPSQPSTSGSPPEALSSPLQQTSARAQPGVSPQPSLTSAPALASTIANEVVGSVLHALQPVSRDLPVLLSGLMLSLAPQAINAIQNIASTPSAGHAARSQSAPQPQAPVAPVDASSPVNTASPRATTTSAPATPVTPPQQSGTTERQTLIGGLFDELARLRAQPSSAPAPASAAALAPQQAPATSAPGDTTQQPSGETSMSAELGVAFAEMLSQADAASAEPGEGQEDEEFSVVSTPSTSAQRRSRSRSRSRSPRRGLVSGTMLTVLMLFTLLIGLVAPTGASALNPHALSRDGGIEARQTGRQLHLCKCTCFGTNSTLVPLYAPADPAKPCSTCTRQFCLDQSLDMCKGAKLEHTDHDVGTGFEGDVWAKCFERDSYKDQSIITLYLLVLVGLIIAAAMRGRMQGWYNDYQSLGPQGIYNAVRQSPWRLGR